MKHKKINIGLIGLGRLGRIYADHFVHRIAQVNLMAVADAQGQLAESCAQELGIPKWYENSMDLVANKDIDAVVVVSPTHTHHDIVVAAAREGKAIFCEKPISLSLEETGLMVQAVEKAGVFFHMGFMRRFDKGYVAAKRKIEDGVIGTPVVFKSSSRDPYPPSLEYAEHSGGMIIDMGIHDIDIVRWFMGEVKSVYSIGATLAYPELQAIGDIDNAITTLTFENGSLGVIDLSRNGVYGYDIRAEVLGTQGALMIGYLRETPLVVMTREGITHDTVPFFMERFGDAYVTQLEDFVSNILHDKEPSITIADGLAALRIGMAATLSQKENNPVEVRSI
ncbi:MAG: inositol 2-dehydrogenase [Candidatus Marinimicrobia bacterium]|nr:inositol 2-dehydrogenase [Candidatus Neomarinimicrobiota bacterium]